MLSPNMVCGYYFDLCGSTANEIYFEQLTHEAYKTAVMAISGAPVNLAADNLLDAKYAGLGTPGASFRIMFMSDLELDASYSVGSAKTCTDAACCHAD